MKIIDVVGKAESNGEIEEQFFSIEDKGMIFDILRNKMYSNPTMAICREISCNARDAHREAGKANVPIIIHLPNFNDPFYKIKDFGPGISPDRMSNIFIKYTASTKRNDNSQTGGFGLGAKTPFAYSNTFNIRTIHNGIQYDYICFIDETKVGKLSLISQVETTEENGTEIIIPVKSNDFNNFATNTEYCTRHWDVKPIIKGNNIYYQSIKEDSGIILKGNDWINAFSNSSYSRSVKLIIDQIEYPLDIEQFRSLKIDQPDQISVFNSLKGYLFLYFSVGEISLSASREQIYIDKPSKIKINEKLQKVLNDIQNIVSKEIQSCKDYYSANVTYSYFCKKFYDTNIIRNIKWNDLKLYNDCIDIKCSIHNFEKGTFAKKYGQNPNKISKSSGRYLELNDRSKIIINDLGIVNLTPRHVKKIFEEDPSLISAIVITPDEKVTVQTLNEDINLNLMYPKFLSSYITYKHKNTSNQSGSRLYVYKYNTSDTSFSRVSLTSAIEDSGKKVLCRLTSNKSPYIRGENNNKYYIDLSTLKSFSDYSFYGVDEFTPEEKIEEVFENFEDLDDIIYDHVAKVDRETFVKTKFLIEMDAIHGLENSHEYIKRKVKDPESTFIKKINCQKTIISERNQAYSNSKLLELYEFLISKITDDEVSDFEKQNIQYDFSGLLEQYNKKYPLLKFISSYSLSSEEASTAVAEYINMADLTS